MKKLALVLMLCAMSSYSVFADTSLDVKGGVAHIDGVAGDSKIGPDFALGLNFGIDKYLEVGPEFSYAFKSYSVNNVDAKNTVLPLMMVGRLRAPMGTVMPYFSMGAGYLWNIYEQGGASWTATGFVAQGMVGVVVSLGGSTDDIWSTGASSQLGLLVEAGYRYSLPEYNNQKISASGVVSRVGVRWNF